MATAYKTQASKMAAGIQPRTMPYCTTDVFSTFAMSNTLGASGFVINDTVWFMTLEGNPADPNGFGPSVASITVDVPALESSTGIVWAVGDDSSGSYVSNYIAGATAGQSGAGGIQSSNVHGSIGFQPFLTFFNTYTTPSDGVCHIIFKVTTGASGTPTTTGTITLKASYTMDP